MTVDAYEEIRRRAVSMMEQRGVDADGDTSSAQALVEGAVEDYQRRAHLGRTKALADPAHMTRRVLRSVTGHGPLTDLLARSDIEEVFIEGSRVTFLDGTGRLHALDEPSSERENRHVVDRLLADADRRLDASSPLVQARILDDTARLTAVIPPIADRLSATIRRYALRRETLDTMVELGSLDGPTAAFLAAAMRATTSVIVSGPPGSGKTSLLSALIAAVPPGRCVRCCEEVRELQVPLVHGSFYEARPPALDGSGAVSLRDLVKLILAMRPDLIVVGEVRGSESYELTRAVNAGCGFACTVHANSAREALDALVNAALMAGENVTERVVRNVFSSTIDLVVHLDRDVGGTGPIRRRVMEVLAVVPALHDDFSTQPLFSRDHIGAPLRWTGALPPSSLIERIERAAADVGSVRDLMAGAEVG